MPSPPVAMYYDSRFSQACNDTAQLFNEHFYSVSNQSTSYPSFISVETTSRLSYITISSNDVWASLICLDPSQASGIDNLNPRVFMIAIAVSAFPPEPTYVAI